MVSMGVRTGRGEPRSFRRETLRPADDEGGPVSPQARNPGEGPHRVDSDGNRSVDLPPEIEPGRSFGIRVATGNADPPGRREAASRQGRRFRTARPQPAASERPEPAVNRTRIGSPVFFPRPSRRGPRRRRSGPLHRPSFSGADGRSLQRRDARVEHKPKRPDALRAPRGERMRPSVRRHGCRRDHGHRRGRADRGRPARKERGRFRKRGPHAAPRRGTANPDGDSSPRTDGNAIQPAARGRGSDSGVQSCPRVVSTRAVDIAFCETAHHALAGLILAKVLRIHCVWDSHTNIELLATSLGKGRVFSVLSAALERFLGRHVDAVITPTERDALGYVQMGVPRSKVHVIRTFVKLPEDSRTARVTREPAARPSASPILLFFGSFKYAPNREALEYIDRVLAPSLEEKGFHGEIRIAGRDIPAIASHPSIRVLGFVPDLLEAIRSADLCIVPVWHGAGVLTKVLDCMAAGVPTVLSPFAADGVPEVRDGVHAYVARDQERFPDRAIEALRRPSQWRGIASSAPELIATHYSWESQKRRLEDVLRVAMTSRE